MPRDDTFRKHPLLRPDFPIILALTMHCDDKVFRPQQRSYDDLDQRQRETYDGMMYDLIRKLRRKP